MGTNLGLTPGAPILQAMPRVGGGSRLRHTSQWSAEGHRSERWSGTKVFR